MWIIIIGIVVVALFLLARQSFEVRAEIELDASQEQIWQTLIALEEYHLWNSQLEYLGGTPAPGEKVHLKLSVEGVDPYEFRPILNHWEKNQRFGWIARTGLPYVFDGEHLFELEQRGDKVLLVNREIYRGLLTPIIQRQPMMKNAPGGFEKMNEELAHFLSSKYANS